MTYAEAIELVYRELERAREKFPHWPTDPIHAAAIVAEEAGELVKAALDYTYLEGTHEDMDKEAAQTAAMGIRFLMNGDYRRRAS